MEEERKKMPGPWDLLARLSKHKKKTLADVSFCLEVRGTMQGNGAYFRERSVALFS